MGLTIHYHLKLARTAEGMDDLQARWASEEVRKLALRFKRQGRIETVGAMGFDPRARRHASEWRTRPVRGQPQSFTADEVRPVGGHLFEVTVGRGCEPLWLGLCCYNRGGWRLKGFCKTQYASLHGREHFLRCHTAVVDLLAAATSTGLRVDINDEGDFWPRRDSEALERALDEMNRMVASTAGLLKDWAQERGQTPVQSPVFSHPQFERLEAEGEVRGHAERLRKVLD